MTVFSSLQRCGENCPLLSVSLSLSFFFFKQMVDHPSLALAVFPPLSLAFYWSTAASVIGGHLLQYLL